MSFAQNTNKEENKKEGGAGILNLDRGGYRDIIIAEQKVRVEEENVEINHSKIKREKKKQDNQSSNHI